jgi:MinD superfamily P-loop ATPase
MDDTRESAQSLIRTAITSLDEAKAAFRAEYRALRPSKGRKCTRCGEPMTVSVTVQRQGSHPEIQAFRCEFCRNVTMLVDGQEEWPVDANDSTVRGVRLFWPSR